MPTPKVKHWIRFVEHDAKMAKESTMTRSKVSLALKGLLVQHGFTMLTESRRF
jgi:hypothetical protein